jgi:adenosine deaminase
LNQCQIDLAKTPNGANGREIAHKSLAVELSERDRAELHVHMNGAIPVSTIQDIFADELTELPSGFLIERDMLRHTPCQSLASYLTPWQVLRLFPKKRENLDRLSLAVVSNLAQNNVRFVELRSSVLYLAALQNCSPAQALERLLESSRTASDRFGMRLGLVLTVTP